MKPLFSVLFLALILSCNRKKSELIDKIELYQDSLNMANTQNSDLAVRMNHLIYSNSDKAGDSLSAANARKKNMASLNSLEYRKMRDSAFVLKWKIYQFQLQIQSLYLELKKY